MSWRPLSLRDQADARFDEPSEGLPPWLLGPVLGWASDSFRTGGYENSEALTALQLAFRLEKPLGGPALSKREDLLRRMSSDHDFALDVIDWMLHHWESFASYYEVDGWVQGLNGTLSEGGSAWEATKIDSRFQLSRRAVGPVIDVLEHTATEATRAHDHLVAAWSKLTGRDPDPSGAYREAVRALEAVAKPVILPNDSLATMGLMISAMRDKPEKWATTLGQVDDVRSQMEVVHKGQLDRHGTDDETIPLNVSPSEADAAFSTCLNLVRLFVGGHVSQTNASE